MKVIELQNGKSTSEIARDLINNAPCKVLVDGAYIIAFSDKARVDDMIEDWKAAKLRNNNG